MIEGRKSGSVRASQYFETTCNVLTTKSNEVASGAVSSYTYAVNQLGQRTQVSQAGSAFATAQSIEWGYDPLGQVTEADHSTDNSQDRNFGYDQIGNRITATEGSNPAQNYTRNALNQYDSIDGQALSYGPDGNLLSDGQRTYTWDGERCEQASIVDRSKATCPQGQNTKNESFDQNRLLSTTEASNSATAQYEYDYLSRRVKKAEGANTATYLYEGWNPVLQTKNGTEQTRYSWGMDLSGSMQGAGGVGGLLAVHKSTGLSGYPTYDGNGNVSEYLDAAGTTIAHYEYDAFGKTTVKIGTQADNFEHRFSTKLIESESGLYYYGYRYYDPATGRWPSRDPIEEQGGINLYGMVGNNLLDKWDYLGLQAGIGKPDWFRDYDLATKNAEKESSKASRGCPCIGYKITVESQAGGARVMLPFVSKTMSSDITGGTSMPITSGHQKPLIPRAQLWWKSNKSCKCKKTNKQARLTVEIIKDSGKSSASPPQSIFMIYSPHGTGGYAPGSVSLRVAGGLAPPTDPSDQIGNKMKIEIRHKGRVCLSKIYDMVDAGGKTNKVPGFSF